MLRCRQACGRPQAGGGAGGWQAHHGARLGFVGLSGLGVQGFQRNGRLGCLWDEVTIQGALGLGQGAHGGARLHGRAMRWDVQLCCVCGGLTVHIALVLGQGCHHGIFPHLVYSCARQPQATPPKTVCPSACGKVRRLRPPDRPGCFTATCMALIRYPDATESSALTSICHGTVHGGVAGLTVHCSTHKGGSDVQQSEMVVWPCSCKTAGCSHAKM